LHVLQFVRLATTGDSAQPTAAVLRKAMAEGIPIQIREAPLEATMDKTQQAVLPRKQREVYDWVMLETDLVEAATHDLLVGRQSGVLRHRLPPQLGGAVRGMPGYGWDASAFSWARAPDRRFNMP
jgi:hypothetical protein